MPDLQAATVAAAERYNLDPAIFASLIQVESGYADDVIYGRRLSSASAGGIAQFMTPTWQGVYDQHPELARDYGAIRDPRGRFDPIPALYASAAHISDMLRQAGGDYRQALGGYYAGYGGRNSGEGRSYAALVLSGAGRTPNLPAVGSGGDAATAVAPVAPAFDMERLFAAIQAAQLQTKTETLDPLAGLVAAAEATGVPSAPATRLPALASNAEVLDTGSFDLAGIQATDRIRAGIVAGRRESAAGTLRDLSPVRQAQLGSIVSGVTRGVREIGTGIKHVVEPFAKPVLKGLELENRYIGHPIAKAAIAGTPLRFLPDRAQHITEEVLSTILVPSTFMMPPVGRAIAVGSVAGRFGMRSLFSPQNIGKEYEAARLVISAMFPNQIRLAARVEVANKFAAAAPEALARRQTAEKLTGELGRIRGQIEELRKVGPDATYAEKNPFGKPTGKLVDKATLELREQRAKAKLDLIKQEAGEDYRHIWTNLGITTDPAMTEALNKTESALREVAKFNEPSRYSPMRLAFFRKHLTGYEGDDTTLFKYLLGDEIPDGIKVTVDDIATREGFNIVGLSKSDPVIVRLTKKAEEQSAGKVRTYQQNREWIKNLGAEGPFDPKAQAGTVYNWAIRASEPLSHVPIIGPAISAPVRGLGTIFQPLGEMDAAGAMMLSGSRYIRAAMNDSLARKSMAEIAIQNGFGKGLVGDSVLEKLYTGPDAVARVEAFIERHLADFRERGIEPSAADVANWRKTLMPGFKRDVGTVAHAGNAPELYDLPEEQAKRLRFLKDDIFNGDLETGQAMGVSVGRIKSDYIPRQRVAGEQLNLGTHSSKVFARAFRKRTIHEYDDWLGATLLDGAQPEYNISNLLDHRLSQMALKKGQQVTMKLLEGDVEMAKFVERPLLTRAKGPIDTRSDEFRTALLRGLQHEMDSATAESVAEGIIRTLPKQLPIKEAEFYLGKELRLKPVGDFVDEADKTIAQKLNNFATGKRTTPVDENFVGKTMDGLRSMMLSMDLSPVGFVQGARTFAQDPVSYIRSIGSAAAWNTTEHGRRIWQIQNTPSLRFWSSKGLQMGSSLDIASPFVRKEGESLATWAGRKATGGVLPPFDWLNGEMMNMVGAAKLHIANTMYSTLLTAQANPEIAGLLKGLPLFDSVTKGKEWKGLQGEDLARAVADGMNNYLGPVEFAKINAEGRPSFFEKMILLTPSWTRGNIGQMLNAPKFGPKGVVARHLFMNQLALQAMVATKLSLALSGKMPSFDPTSSDFLAVQAGSFRFNLMPNMSTFRLPFRLLAGRPENERFKEENIWGERAEELTRFFEGRMAQGPRIVADLLQGEDYLGRKIDAPEQYVLKELTPIIAQTIWETTDEGNVPAGEQAARAGLEFLGSQVIPKTPFQLYREKAELLSGIPYDDMTAVEKKRLEAEYPELQDLRARQHQYRERRGDAMDQFFNLSEDTRNKANDQITTFIDAKMGSEEFLSQYAKLSADSLAVIGQQTEASVNALFGSREEFQQRLSQKPASALDEVARSYWSLSPDSFEGVDGKRWDMNVSFLDPDPDSYRNELWAAYRTKRDRILADGAAQYGLDPERIEQYVMRDWPSVRWRDHRAADLEVRRVAAQRALDDIFSESPYQWLDGQKFSAEETQRLRDLKVSVEQILSPVRATFQAGGQDLPEGSRRRAIAQLIGQAESDTDQRLLSWMLLFSKEKIRPMLQNPNRDRILIENPDAIKMFPDRVRFLLSSRLLNTPLGSDPEVVRIIQNAIAR